MFLLLTSTRGRDHEEESGVRPWPPRSLRCSCAPVLAFWRPRTARRSRTSDWRMQNVASGAGPSGTMAAGSPSGGTTEPPGRLLHVAAASPQTGHRRLRVGSGVRPPAPRRGRRPCGGSRRPTARSPRGTQRVRRIGPPARRRCRRNREAAPCRRHSAPGAAPIRSTASSTSMSRSTGRGAACHRRGIPPRPHPDVGWFEDLAGFVTSFLVGVPRW